ncbi:probable proline--tRNA ligase, mitochondrial [Hyposmocoma kahamanoa]|uniref:probable proline--tRNA ligase, mitochondrial n=1 Tax=Hyposmocoma kahamanoa TaxID=1477025 RepID=UPI000E6D8D96|nr:probable proline--tRNA ligase, mitochondrial [Hyposmocoma kahamanoa]
MRYVSQIFQPIITIPKNAKIKNTEITCKSQKLLLECGLVRPTSSGLFTLLPLACRALDKLEALVRSCLEEVGGQRVSLPALTAEGLWEKTGRLHQVGTELLKLRDRHEKIYLLAPTHEEAIADLLADVGPLSYKQLPLLLYQISSKYRDEHRPKHGLLRAREFIMMDAYGAHADVDDATAVYNKMTRQFRRLFQRLQLPVYRVQAPSGDMGGSLSHEWQLRANAGEDALCVCSSCSHSQRDTGNATCDECGKEMEKCNSIEVGHTFILGTKYSAPLAANFTSSSQSQGLPVVMSCYGIGITRLLAASLEALSSEKSLRWPKAIAPHSAIIIGPKEGSKEWFSFSSDKLNRLHALLSSTHALNDVLLDDRHSYTIGKRLMMADRLGYPTIIVCGRSTLESPPRFEVYHPNPDKDVSMLLMTEEELLGHLNKEENHVLIDNKI